MCEENVINMYKSVCFSGHRLDKLLKIINPTDIVSNNEDISSIRNRFLEVIKSVMYLKITNYIYNGFRTFYIGMSNGIDLWVGEILLELKSIQYPDIEIVLVRPFKNHGYNFSTYDKLLYTKIRKEATQEIYLHENSSKSAYLDRNRYMVENTNNLLAFIYSYNSGTGYTVKYAKSLNKSIEIVNLLKLSKGFIEYYNKGENCFNMMDYI